MRAALAFNVLKFVESLQYLHEDEYLEKCNWSFQEFGGWLNATKTLNYKNSWKLVNFYILAASKEPFSGGSADCVVLFVNSFTFGYPV